MLLWLFLCLCGTFAASAHDTDFASVLVHILSVFYLMGVLAFYPAQTECIDHILRAAISGLQLWG